MLTAVVTSAALFASLAVSASTVSADVDEAVTTSSYIIGDINGDSTITMSDWVALSKVLAGLNTLSNYSAADLNSNYVVDAVDVQILSGFLVGTVPYLPYTG